MDGRVWISGCVNNSIYSKMQFSSRKMDGVPITGFYHLVQFYRSSQASYSNRSFMWSCTRKDILLQICGIWNLASKHHLSVKGCSLSYVSVVDDSNLIPGITGVQIFGWCATQGIMTFWPYQGPLKALCSWAHISGRFIMTLQNAPGRVKIPTSSI